MNIKPIVFLGLVSMMVACTSAPGEVSSYDPDVSEYRIFLSSLDRQVSEMVYNSASSSKAMDILHVRDDIYRLMGSTRSIAEFSNAEFAEFRALTHELYRRMCSESRFIAERAYLYDMLVAPNLGRQVAGI